MATTNEQHKVYSLAYDGSENNVNDAHFEFAQIKDLSNTAFGGSATNFKPEEWLSTEEIRVWVSGKTINTTKGNDHSRLYKTIINPYEIRVLEIKPGCNNEKLRGSLHHCSVEFEYDTIVDQFGLRRTTNTMHALSVENLTTPIWYTALSYTWGSSSMDGSIECDGHEKAITTSLEIALRNMRKEDHPIVMWIDQICINQEDNREKEMQIPLMARIYKHAFNTVIWLGQWGPDSDSVIQLLKDINITLLFNQSNVDSENFERMQLPRSDSKTWHALWRFLSHPWFTRLWIIQEVMLSNDPWIMCGDELLMWDEFSKAVNHLSTCGIFQWLQLKFANVEDSSELGDISQTVLGLTRQREHYRSASDGTHIFENLVSTRGGQCFDPRDKIYGLLGVCSDADKFHIRYSDFTENQLYHDVAINSLTKDIQILTPSIVFKSIDHESLDLPSWVPDWRKHRQTHELGTYNASGSFKFKSNNVYVKINNESRNELRIRGVPFDSLIRTSATITHPDLTYLNPHNGNKSLLELWTFVSKSKHYPSSHTVFHAFWQTLVGSKTDSGRLPCPDSFAEIISLLLDASTGQSPSLSGQTYSPRQQKPLGKGRLELDNLAHRVLGQTFQEVREAMKYVLKNRRWGITRKGYFGLFPRYAEERDIVYVMDGCNVPYLLREVDGENRFRLVGECYVFGIMDGEAVRGEGFAFEEIILV
ncbi:putative heterokaryon incompatibility protein [Botrytis fragariae]|uniref:Putative heterokaryon incompatibility protein n=1 Tax=Botrytis fragariae TaxID=1964551 RepID=A0A8H6ATJ8_9HELO|nr:putative heterokaryon incompatibility protein [Botrytis fragariae]KAF5873533.1 putative heterokaryon incompatibility protein [Botrytis fragariae]